jgi:putative oxidoreductase
MNATNTHPNDMLLLIGRILIVILFLISGYGKITSFSGTEGYMASAGIPVLFIWPDIALEMLGSLAILVGFRTKEISVIFVINSIIAAVIFHNNFADQGQVFNFWKNISIAGGFLFLLASGAGKYSLDAKKLNL